MTPLPLRLPLEVRPQVCALIPLLWKSPQTWIILVLQTHCLPPHSSPFIHNLSGCRGSQLREFLQTWEHSMPPSKPPLLLMRNPSPKPFNPCQHTQHMLTVSWYPLKKNLHNDADTYLTWVSTPHSFIVLDTGDLLDNINSTIQENPIYLSSDTKSEKPHYSYNSSFSYVYPPSPP